VIIRVAQQSDMEVVKQIHAKFFADEFEFPNFMSMLAAFVVEEDGEIVSIGGIRPIAESIIVTNKKFSPRDRRTALLLLLQASLFATDKFNFDQLHAFVQDEKWLKQLVQYGFQPCKGEAVFVGV